MQSGGGDSGTFRGGVWWSEGDYRERCGVNAGVGVEEALLLEGGGGSGEVHENADGVGGESGDGTEGKYNCSVIYIWNLF